MPKAIKERPILFSGPMVTAILAGDKTQTRRAFKPFGTNIFKETMKLLCLKIGVLKAYLPYTYKGPYGNIGDRLWVRETFIDLEKNPITGAGKEKYIALKYWYKADNKGEMEVSGRWTSSIHMPRIASRIQLEIIDIRFERLKDISEADAKAEGVQMETADPPFFYVPGNWPTHITAVETYEGRIASFKKLWDYINGKGGEAWITNPWVWVIEFKNITGQKGA